MKRLLGSIVMAIALIPGVLALQSSAHAASGRAISPNYCVMGGPCGPCDPDGHCLDIAYPHYRW